MNRFFRSNGLTLVLMAVFFATWIGQFLTGWRVLNEDEREHGRALTSIGSYVVCGHFWQATGENWESEFLQMSMFVVLTCCLYQRGSPESKDPDGDDASPYDDVVAQRTNPRAPWPVRRGGVALWLYKRSLTICFFALFVLSVVIHAWGGERIYNLVQLEHGQPAVSLLGFLGTSEFWFQSFQNWQSEFLSLAAMVYLSVYLRQQGSAESKPVATPHLEQGD